MTERAERIARSVQYVYRADGTFTERARYAPYKVREMGRAPTLAKSLSIAQIMTREVTCGRQDLGAKDIIELMIRKRLGCLPVVNSEGKPVGMVTKLDLVEPLVTDRGAADDPSARSLMPKTARELMMPVAITLEEHQSIADAAALMAGENVHHLPVVDAAGHLVGLVSTMDVVRWLAANDCSAAVEQDT